MNINILTIPDNEEFMSIEVDNNKPVKEIKTFLENSLNLLVKDIIYNGEVLDDTLLLEDYDFNEEKYLVLVLGKKQIQSTTSGLMQTILQTALNTTRNGETATISIPLSQSTETLATSGLLELASAFTSSNVDISISAELENDEDDLLDTNDTESEPENETEIPLAPPYPLFSIPLSPPVPIPPPTPEYIYQQQLDTLLGMGFVDPISIRVALDITNGSIEDALVYL